MAEYNRVQPRQLVAAAGAAEEYRHVVTDQPAAAAGEDRWPLAQRCALLLAAAGAESPDAAAV
jgi:hypothetical protein